MQEGAKKARKKRLIITFTTTSCLFVFPFTKFPENLYFLVPGIAEAGAFFLIIIWVEVKSHFIKRKKKATTQQLFSTLNKSIETLKGEINNTPDKSVKNILKEQLAELYKERGQEDAIQRKKLRHDLGKLEEDEKSCKQESEALREQLIQKAEEQAEKILEESQKNKQTNDNQNK